MRYLCSGSLSTFRCVIPSILTIGGGRGGVTDRRRGVVYPLYSLFLQGRAGAEKRGGGPESWGSGPWMRYQLHVVRRCGRGGGARERGGEGGGEGKRGRGAVKQPFVDRPFSVHPYSSLASSSSRQQQGVICTYQLCLPATKGPASMTSLSPISRSNDPMIFTLGF